MLDIRKEIEAYDSIALEQGAAVQDHLELQEIMKGFTRAFERLGKEQYKFSQQLEDIFSMLEGEEGQQSGNQGANEKRELEKEGFLQVFLELVDSLEDIYRYALLSGQESWRKQLSLQWQKVGKQMEERGVRRIGVAGGIFDPRLHAAGEVKEYPGVSDGQILDILRSGYMLGETILRKAEVVVNRFKA